MGSDPREMILAAIPHRPPFLFVDRIVERGESTIVTEWDVRAELDALRGHYPGRPVLPGVLACEMCFQSAAILFSGETPSAALKEGHGAVPVLTRIEDARFKHMVEPGTTLRARIECTERLANARWMQAHVTANEKSVLRIRFAVALVAPATSTGSPAAREAR